MQTKYFFSIVIPTFNAAKTIENCLKSILEQTFNAYEILIIDGQSTDNTLAIISSFNNSKVQVISEADQGIYDAMNKGIDLSKGEYLYFLGSDDTLFDDEVLTKTNSAITNDPEKIVYGNVKMNGSNKFVADGMIYGGEFDLKRILSHNIPHQAIFYHRSIFTKLGGYNLKYSVFADHDFNIKAFSKYQFKYIDLIVANFFVGGASTTSFDTFEEDKIANIVNYYKDNLSDQSFVPLRYYVQQAAFNPLVKMDFTQRIYYALLYAKLKLQSLIY